MNNHLVVKKTKNGFGLFTEVTIPANTPIYEFTGDIFNSENFPSHQDENLFMQIGVDLFLGPSGGKDDHVNHSCDPNCYIYIVGNRAILYSKYLIAANCELTFDYSLSSTETREQWQFNCNCESINCRKIISGFQYLDKKKQDQYIKDGIVPLFISDQRFMRK